VVTDKYARAEVKLGQPLAAWLKAHRDKGMSWRWIAIELARLTGVQVSDVTLAQWFRDTSHSVTYQVDPFKLAQ
jgi:hypothetical protein